MPGKATLSAEDPSVDSTGPKDPLAVTFKEVFQDELLQIAESRQAREVSTSKPTASSEQAIKMGDGMICVNDEAEFAVISTMQMKRSTVFRHYTNSGKCRAVGRLHHSLGSRLSNRWAAIH